MRYSDFRLKVELVPENVWYFNLRSEFKTFQWDFLRKIIYELANHRCEICGGRGRKRLVEAHEEWNYDDKKHIITLVKITALCPSCHRCKHLGLAQVQGTYDKALKHLAKVNKISYTEAEKYSDYVFDIWEKRSEHFWEIDISSQLDWINKNYPVKLSKSEEELLRKNIVEKIRKKRGK